MEKIEDKKPAYAGFFNHRMKVSQADTLQKSEQYFKNHLPALDLLRAISIVMVLLFHFSGSFSLPRESYIARFFFWGKHGVDLFFVLSGFLIGGQIAESTLRGAFSFKVFYFKRFWRIFPAYYFSILVYALLVYYFSGGNLFNNSGVIKDILIHIFYTQNYFNPSMYGGIYWTLAVEEQFYIVIPVLLYLLIKRSPGSTVPAFLLILLSSIAVTYFLYDQSDWWYYFMDHNIRGFSALLSGVATAFLWIRYRDRLRNIPSILPAAILAASCAILFVSYIKDSTLGMSWHESLWQFIPTSIGFSGLILYLSIKPFSFPLKWLIKTVARLSYTIYLYHVLVAVLLRYVIKSQGIVFNTASLSSFAAVFSVYLILVIVLCQIAYYLIERPTMRFRENFLRKKSLLDP
ncbi:MAG TPA: hypothetical protein DDW94_06270 [Deltaproteobacteria bacterium]|nr:MAG: hypothetical protein A2Z79_00800 [Deltaproteobacteria bacterium GWA2_55_82]OGQ64275.1 MAG: hypothetical protein A3I81_13125 [Deltaproteobacteria bacterium RIFCSPLOWO2_02_FULL_55_12]OIJ73982.1 MAG: hypothetical protein A2V21_306710 [Deltaproteobacteria bacterium GWC2_55_46]HBG46582.1 hypothetical protein [Deltaproteobacteria bacterium]HCY09984.1 hypothetical protein [Deltaproteobacteria bacterium]